jgi:hypothetical protein
MKTPKAFQNLLVGSLVAILHIMPLHVSGAPEGLVASDWSSIQAAYQTGRHAFHREADGTHVARNPGQAWRIEFDSRGFSTRPEGGGWVWGLELVEPVTGGQFDLAEARTVVATGNKLTVTHNAQLDEWFINTPQGLEQGWTFNEAGAANADQSLRLKLAVRGQLKGQASADGRSVGFVDEDGTTILTYSGLKAWDAKGRPLPAVMRANDTHVLVEVDARGAGYPVTIDPIAQQAYLKASNTDAGDQFGDSVSVSGNTVVVGAPDEASNATGINGNQANDSSPGAGAVYVFVRNGNTWSQQAYLKASNTDDDTDLFGRSVSISGDTLVVGAPQEDSNAVGVNNPNQANDSAPNAGAVYVFVRSGGLWSQQAYLKASNTGGADNFGSDVSIYGNTIAVGAPLEDSNATGVNGNQFDNSVRDAGAVYVFVRSGTFWTQQAYIKASNPDQDDFFARSLALSGNTLVVGANEEDSNATGANGNQGNDIVRPDSGAAYVFVRSGSTWSQQAYLKASNSGPVDFFGTDVAISGDTLVVGAEEEDSIATGVNGSQLEGASNSGAAYVFVRSGTTWSQQGYLKASNTDPGDEFGGSVAISGDRVIIGARREESTATGVTGDQSNDDFDSAGAAYLFQRQGGIWFQVAYLKASNTGGGDNFGEDVAISGDIAVVGALGEDSSVAGANSPSPDNNTAEDAGAAYIFSVGALLNTLAKTGHSAPDVPDIAFGTPGFGAVNGAGQAIYETGLTGSDAVAPADRAIFSTLAPDGGLDLVLQSNTSLAGFGGLPAATRVAALKPPISNQLSHGVFPTTVSGTGITIDNNCLLLHDNGDFLSLLQRTGVPVAQLGNDTPRAFREMVQHSFVNLLAVSYLLKASTADAVNTTNDSGILMLNHQGGVSAANAREGNLAFGGGGVFGQFSGKAATFGTVRVRFIAKFIPDGETPRDALFTTNATGGINSRFGPTQGDPAPGTINGERLGAFVAATDMAAGDRGLLRATLTNSSSATNDGVWDTTGALLLRKGEPIGGGLTVARIIRFWPVNAFGQIVFQVQLAGTGVTTLNNSALILRQVNNAFLILLRTGSPAPGIGLNNVTVSAISAVDVNPTFGHYAVLGTLAGGGTAATNNQALWTGRTAAGTDGTAHVRLPRLLLRKGDRYGTAVTPVDTIKGLVLKPAVDTTGAGGRGLAQVVGEDGHILAAIIGDRLAQEVVVIEP